MTFNTGTQATVGGTGAESATANGMNRKTWFVSNSAPSFTVDGVTFPENGTLWLDTTTTPPTPKIYNGTTWKVFVLEDATNTLSNKTLAAASVTGALTVDNNVAINAKNSGATSRTLIYRDNSNTIQLGDSAQNTGLTINEPVNALAGAALWHANDTLRTHTGDTSTVKIKESTVYMPGTYTIKFDAKFDAAGGGTGNARVYKNGVALGTNRSLTTGFVTYSEDLGTFAIGDLVQVFGGNSAAASTVSVQNFRLYAKWAPNALATSGF